MARSATRRRPPAAQPAAAGEINPKAPCPCGSGRRYKHCHGSGYAPPVTRPFEGLPGEADWVALRELVPAATATLRTTEGREATLARDRKSTRLNSSHLVISYAVFCLKKKMART